MAAIHFPTLNAILNSACVVFLLGGLYFIKRRQWRWHAGAMTGAFACSILFLSSYLYYHYHYGSTTFTGTGPIRFFYFTILVSHTILAVLIVPLALTTGFWALRQRFKSHVKIARITWPIWLYVSFTGIVIYWMLYRM